MTLNATDEYLALCDTAPMGWEAGVAYCEFCGILPTDDLHVIKKKLRWGTFGKGGRDPLKIVRLIDCSTEHLEAILATQPLKPILRVAISAILLDRKSV